MNTALRPYEKKDYATCEALVSAAWGFDTLFRSENLRAIAKRLYTQGSYVASNYGAVATHGDRVVGFIFGDVCARPKPKRALLFALKANFDILTKPMDKAERKSLVDAIHAHQKNRQAMAPQKSNEIVLFVVDDAFQGQGIGKALWAGFKHACLEQDDSVIRVETNAAGAARFYERLGFTHTVDFNSPLHAIATPGGQACLYEYTHGTPPQP